MDHDLAPARPGPRARLSEPGSPVCTPDWLALREPADHAARSVELAERASVWLGDREDVVIRDLGCGTGSMGRWLAPRLPQRQRWFVHDRDAGLAHRAAASLPVPATAVVGDALGTDLAGADLVVCSALLDLLTAPEVQALAAVCGAVGCAVLLTLSVTGEVALDPPEPDDAAVAAAFDAHQRRDGLLGPDAPAVAVAAFERAGYVVHRRPSPWHLEPGALAEEWLRGRLDAAAEHDPTLDADAHLAHRLATPFSAVVGHADLLAVPR